MFARILNVIEKVFDQSRLGYYIIIAPIVGILVGLFAIQEDPVLLLVGFFLASRYILFNDSKILPYIIIFPVFFADWFSALGYIPYSFTWLPDVGLLIFALKVVITRMLDKKRIQTCLDLPLLAFIGWGIIAMIMTGGSPLDLFYSLRQMFKYVLMFYIFIHINYDEKFLKTLNWILLGLFFIQVPTALAKMTVFGRSEWAIGTYAYFGGGLSAVLPLFVNAVCLGFYFFNKPKWQYLAFMVYFQLFYYACPKRAYPLFAIALVAFILSKVGFGNIKRILPLSPLIVLFLAAGLYVNPDWNQLFTDPKSAVEWVTSYEYQHQGEVTSGRTAVAELVIKKLTSNPASFLFGFGPGSMTESFTRDKDDLHDMLSIYYGITEFVIIGLEYGIIGWFLFFWILLTMYRTTHHIFIHIKDTYWKSIAFGFIGILFSSVIALFYTPVFRLEVSGFLIWYTFAVLVTIARQHKTGRWKEEYAAQV